jgi:hypothetical protein
MSDFESGRMMQFHINNMIKEKLGDLNRGKKVFHLLLFIFAQSGPGLRKRNAISIF